MKKDGSRYIYSPSDLITFMRSDYTSWLDRFDKEFPGRLNKDEPDEMQQFLQQKGNAHEEAYLQLLQDQGKDVCVIDREASVATTLEALREGREVIYQARLELDNFGGYADFLVRQDGESQLGPYHYQVLDTKLALDTKPTYIIQLCCYSEMLEAIQGVRASIGVVLGNRNIHSFRTDDFFYFYQQLKEAFLEQQRNFDPNCPPALTGMDDYGRWTSHVEQILEECDHLSRVANIKTLQINKLIGAGITTLQGLATTELQHIAKMQPTTFNTLRQQARLQLESAHLPQPRYEVLPADPINPRRGLALLPPSSELDVFFDMEGFPFAENGLEYLFGAAHIESTDTQYQDWWGHNNVEEKAAFEQFVDWSYARWQQDPSMHIYHYGAYEKTALRKLMTRYATREDEVDTLLRKEVFVDLYTVVRQSLCVGEPRYSIKNIEHLVGKVRSGAVTKASDSVIKYGQWTISKDGNDCSTSTILSEIREYNKDDCVSLSALADWLRSVQLEHSIAWVPKPPREKDNDNTEVSDGAKKRDAAKDLATLLLSAIPDDRSNDSEEWRIQELLAHLLLFHKREEKPIWWDMFDRHGMTEEELIDDMDCLGSLERTELAPQPIRQSSLYQYRFDPDQDTKLHEGSKCYYAHDLDQTTTIEELDCDTGLVSIVLSNGTLAPPSRLSLIPQDFIGPRTIEDAIFRLVSRWNSSRTLPQALDDFLKRKLPRIRDKNPGAILTIGKDLVEDAADIIMRLESSALCIQGPPGSGKTRTAAHAIVRLLAAGKTVGVSSNSHEAICHLMAKVVEGSALANVAVNGVEIRGNKEHQLFQHEQVKLATSSSEVFNGAPLKYNLIGGTAWAFSKDTAANTLDYLFIDEAGQVPVANLVGMAESSKNLVLIGDQMQLAQPTRAVHPGESGLSILEYLLQDHQTIPADLGIFLGVTHRMHPDICTVVSGTVYEDRLQSHARTANRVLILPDDKSERLITVNSGVMYVPVPHEGNSQCSDEEVEIIAKLVKELLVMKVTDGTGEQARSITLEDILIVAPYNMQVRKLQSAIPGVRAGSVDKFQGKDAPVVIMSMCSSTADASVRGLDFLMSKHRLNVAISRAETLAIMVANPALTHTNCTTVEHMRLVNMFCRIVAADRKSLDTQTLVGIS